MASNALQEIAKWRLEAKEDNNRRYFFRLTKLLL